MGIDVSYVLLRAILARCKVASFGVIWYFLVGVAVE